MIDATTRCVRFLGASKEQATYRGHDDPRGCLRVGQTYAVLVIKVSDWYTTIRLAVCPEKRFNSVCFDAVDDEGAPHAHHQS